MSGLDWIYLVAAIMAASVAGELIARRIKWMGKPRCHHGPTLEAAQLVATTWAFTAPDRETWHAELYEACEALADCFPPDATQDPLYPFPGDGARS